MGSANALLKVVMGGGKVCTSVILSSTPGEEDGHDLDSSLLKAEVETCDDYKVNLRKDLLLGDCDQCLLYVAPSFVLYSANSLGGNEEFC